MPEASDGSGSTVRPLSGCALCRSRRWHVIEEPTVLVVDDDEDGLCPDIGIRDEGVQDLLHEELAVFGRSRRVLAFSQRRHDPRDLRQGTGCDVGNEVRRVGVAERLRGHLDLCGSRRLVEGLEVRKRAELEEGGRVVVDLPAHPGGTQLLGHCRPRKGPVVDLPLARLGYEARSAGDTGGIDRSRKWT